jgi:GTP pyrophosphokinase
MSKVKNELEELSFKYLEPKAYEALRARSRPSARRPKRYRRADTDDRAQAARGAGAGHQARWTHQAPLQHPLKLKRQKIDLERVYDFVALRVITQSVKDCYAALGIIHQTWSPCRPHQGLHRDAAAQRYQSLHTSVISEHGFPFEVQIRTEEMHRRAEEGIAAHWKYKEGRVGDHRDERYFQWMRQLLEVQQEVRDPQEFLQNLKIDLYPRRSTSSRRRARCVAAARRDGGRLRLQHSHRRRQQCVGARINGRMVPLRTRCRTATSSRS